MESFQYVIVEGTNIREVEGEVSSYLNDGFKLHGSLNVVPNYVKDGESITLSFSQALVKNTTVPGKFKVAK